MTKERINSYAKRLARDVMDLSDRRDYGIGEMRYNFEVWGFDFMQDEYDVALDYDIDNGDGINWEERKRFQTEQPELYSEWRAIVAKAHEIADTLSEMGVTTFN